MPSLHGPVAPLYAGRSPSPAIADLTPPREARPGACATPPCRLPFTPARHTGEVTRPDVRLRPARWLLAAVSCLGVVLFTVPGHLGLWQTYPFTQLSSMRMLTALGILVGGLCCVAWAVATRRGELVRPSTVTAAVSILCATGVVGSLLASGAARSEVARPGEPELTIMSLNASDTSADDVAAAAIDVGADAVLLVESPAEVVEGVAALLGEEATAFTNVERAVSKFTSVGIVVRDGLGRYEPTQGPELQLGSVALTGEGPGPAHLAVVHPPPPVSRWAPAQRWSSQLRVAATWCEEQEDAIVGGDFNAVADHLRRAGLDRCESATDVLGLSARGTWPVDFPAWLGAGIDHVLSDPAEWEALSARVLEVGVTDHRAVVVQYRRP